MDRPIIVAPMGDAAGIGPEILLKALSDPQLDDARVLVVGDAKIMALAKTIVGAPVTLQPVADIRDATFAPGMVPVLDMDKIDIVDFRFGEVSGMCGRAAYAYIEKCVALAMAGQVDGVATTPIQKEALRLGGVPYIGHTEIFGALTHTDDPLTMFQVHSLRVFFLTRHMPLREACDMVTKERIVDYGVRCAQALEKLGMGGGTMAVAALNPHSGESGRFGDTENREIAPAVAELQARGYAVEGPISADAVFHQAKIGKYSSVLSLYHDQGHIACKTLDFDKTVAITCGLPILRASVDHGTAYDIAGQGVASPVSMIEAILTAEQYAPLFRKKSADT